MISPSMFLCHAFNYIMAQLPEMTAEQRLPLHDALHIIVYSQQQIRDDYSKIGVEVEK